MHLARVFYRGSLGAVLRFLLSTWKSRWSLKRDRQCMCMQSWAYQNHFRCWVWYNLSCNVRRVKNIFQWNKCKVVINKNQRLCESSDNETNEKHPKTFEVKSDLSKTDVKLNWFKKLKMSRHLTGIVIKFLLLFSLWTVECIFHQVRQLGKINNFEITSIRFVNKVG